MDKTVEDLLAANIQEVRASLLSFQDETRENFRKVDDQFAELRGDLHSELRRVEQNMYSLFAVLFSHLGIDTPPDLLK